MIDLESKGFVAGDCQKMPPGVRPFDKLRTGITRG